MEIHTMYYFPSSLFIYLSIYLLKFMNIITDEKSQIHLDYSELRNSWLKDNYFYDIYVHTTEL